MLKKFFLNTLSSFVGAWLAIVLGGVVVVMVAIGLIAKVSLSSINQESGLGNSKILCLELDGVITETEENPSFSVTDVISGGSMAKSQTLKNITTALKEAADSKDIEVLYIKGGSISAGPATVHAIREAVEEFKKSGKKVFAYADSYGQGSYYIASAADVVMLNPQGMIELSGLGSVSMYFKGLLDKVGVQYQVVKVGTYKSAVEPFILDKMSEPARAQLDTLYTTMWNFLTSEMAKSRNITPEKINNLINDDILLARDAKFCMQNKLVDKLVYEREIDNMLAKEVNVDKKKLTYASVSQMVSGIGLTDNYSAKRRIAVLYATGEIAENTSNGINCYDLVPIITELAEDDKVEALVLRVNSPGGSVFGSEQIREALAYFKSKKKPFAVSMGDYAASGGYWISSGADRIFADPLTITGSIGIFGLLPNAQQLEDKIGVTLNEVSTNPNGLIAVPYVPLNEDQIAGMQRMVNQGYDQFISTVSKGRHIPEASVRKIGEGRVWSAITAENLKLVDQLGNLEDAVKWVAKKADLGDDYNVAYYPEAKPNLLAMLMQMSAGSDYATLKSALGDCLTDEMIYNLYCIFTRKPLQARMINIEVII